MRIVASKTETETSAGAMSAEQAREEAACTFRCTGISMGSADYRVCENRGLAASRPVLLH